MLYINRTAKGNYVELDSQLDPESNVIGTTWEEYMKGAWILLSDEQVAFKEANETATVKEVFNMKIEETEVDTESSLEILKKHKLQEAEAADLESNKFYVSVTQGGTEVQNQQFWIDKDLRNSLYSITLPALKADGVASTKLWTTTTPPVSIEVPVDWALEKLPLLEVYAKKTYDRRAENEAAIYAAYESDDEAALNTIDVYENYPLPLTFELNLDVWS